MKKFLKIAKNISLLYSTILTTICICNIFPRSENLNFDYSGIIVGILSILVTLLIGWNILSVLNMKEEITNIKNISNKTQEETMARAYTSIMNQTSYIVEGRDNNDDCFNAISNGLFACKHYHLAKNFKARDNLLKMILGFKKENCSLSKKNLNDLRTISGQLEELGIEIKEISDWINEYEERYQKPST